MSIIIIMSIQPVVAIGKSMQSWFHIIFLGVKFSVKSRADGQKNSKRNGVKSKLIQNVIEYR